MNIKEEYLSILQNPNERFPAIHRLGRENVFLLVQDMKERGFLREEPGSLLSRAAGETTYAQTQKGRVFLRSNGVRAAAAPKNSPHHEGLERLAEELAAVEPQIRRGTVLRLTYAGGDTETVRYHCCWYAHYAGSSGWKAYGGDNLLRALYPYLAYVTNWRLELPEAL